MAFPTTVVIDDFNRADENPPVGWTDIGGDAKVASNRLAQTGTGGNIYWNLSMPGPDVECYITMITPPVANHVAVRARRNPGVNAGYIVRVHDGAPDHMTIEDPSDTVLNDTNLGFDIATGDSFGISCIGSTIKSWYKRSGQSWQEIASVVNSANDGTGSNNKFSVFLGNDANAVLDNFGGGVFWVQEADSTYKNRVVTSPRW